MSDETPGAGQGALPPREGSTPRPVAECPAVRLTQVAGGQYVLTSQTHSIPALTQISGTTNATFSQAGVTRIISISPSRGQAQNTSLSLANQSIVNALTKTRPGQNVRLQLFPVAEAGRSPVKRSLPPTPEKKDTYVQKLQRVMNHRNVRSKIVKEKYNEHLLETYFLELGGNILDLYQFAKRPKTQQFLQYLKENAIDPQEHAEETQTQVPVTTPTATLASSLPGATQNVTSAPTVVIGAPAEVSVKTPVVNKTKMPVGYPTATTNQEHIVEKAKQEAYVVQRIGDLQREGLWSERRLPKVQEQPRAKAHWDFLLEEMVWLAADFAQERKWKKAAAKKCARMVQKYFQDKALAAQRAEKAHEQNLRRIAAYCAKEIKNFWSNVEKLVEYKQNTRLEEKRKKALDQHLSFIVDQTEKYSQLLAEGMNKSVTSEANPASTPPSRPTSRPPSRGNSDEEFRPDENSSDDEETIAQAEAGEAEQSEEVAALQRESEMDFESFLSELPKDYLQNRDKIMLSGSDESEEESESESKSETKKSKSRTEDEDFEAQMSSEDDEDTIQEQEQAEGSQNHEEELKDLEAENEMSVEELRKKYGSLPPVPDEDSSGSTDASAVEEESESSSEGSDTEMDVDVDSESREGEVGLRSLLDDSHNEGESTKTDKNNDLINDAAAIAESIQPKGNTLSSTSVVTQVPFLLKYTLREYQHIGLDWLVTMFERKLNGILADEMGLGKTIQTIALLAHLACEKGNWGPHLIIVPTSVMLNWEMECKKWCPAFKILTYYGTQKERKAKRTGWTKPNAFHVCITSYKLVIQDHQSFRRKKWKYLILDEAQNIKNFKSQRWQLLLNFQTQQRLLLTGTPLQNNLMELWSLMHFLMPHVFQSHREFKEWFSNPVTGMIEGNSEYNESIIKRLHKVLRPFLLRRLKCEVEKQMPKKYEHIIMCRLSKRQRYLYDDYMSRAKTKETLASGNLLSVINVLMQLRKVCNHPNLFEVRPTISPFQCEGIVFHVPSLVFNALDYDPYKHIDLYSMNLNLAQMEFSLSAYQCYRMRQYKTPRKLIIEMEEKPDVQPYCPPTKLAMKVIKGPEVKQETPDANLNAGVKNSPNIKLKIPPNYGIQLVQQAIGIPLVSVSQPNSASQTPAGVNVASVLKPSDKISASFAQLVQTSTGKHILLTSNPTPNLPLLSKPVATSGNAGHQITKAYVKFQLTSVTGASTNTSNTTSVADVNATSETKSEDESVRKTVGTKFIDKLYSKQSNSLDVRWNEGDAKAANENDDDNPEENRKRRLNLMARINDKRCSATPMYGNDFQNSIKILVPSKTHSPWSCGRNHCLNSLYNINLYESTDCLKNLVFTPERRIKRMEDSFDHFIVYVPAVRAPEPELRAWHPSPSNFWGEKRQTKVLAKCVSKCAAPLHRIASAMVTQFPDPRLIQYDCGKLQTLDRLLRKLKSEGHRVLIFTQMTKMLDVLEAFLNYLGHIYLRLDGSTKVDQRQVLMERFNGDTRIFVFILSTRSGGIGVNLTGADTVIFYDSDWNPTMDAQAQDRCHRIGQTRDVHIYRLVSERTIEENILKKANQKRLLGDLAIEGGNFTTAYFKSSTIQDLFDIDANEESAANRMSEVVESTRDRDARRTGGGGDEAGASPVPAGEDRTAMGALENALAACEDDQDVQAARTAKAEAVADLAEFDENIPLEEQEKEKEPEISKAEQEVENLVKQLTPVERYAMRFIEQTEAAWSAEQLAAAEREIEEQKREWEKNRLIAMQEEEERRAREMEEEADILTYSREDATNQVSSKSKKLSAKLNNSGSSGKKLRKVITVQSKNAKNKGGEADDKQKPKFKPKSSRFSNRIRKNSGVKIEEIDDNSQSSTASNAESVKVNGDSTDSNGKWSLESSQNSGSETSDSDSLPLLPRSRVASNHVDHNSPRTRSRGTVAINLWTLDVSPILPGVKPVKGCPGTSLVKRERSRNSSSEKEIDADGKIKRRKGGADKQISAQKMENLEKRGGRLRIGESVQNNKKFGKAKNLKSKIIDAKDLSDSCEINLVCNATTDDDKSLVKESKVSDNQQNDARETNKRLNNHDSVNSTEETTENFKENTEETVDKNEENIDKIKESVDKTNKTVEKPKETVSKDKQTVGETKKNFDKPKESVNCTKAQTEEVVNYCKEKVCKVVVEDVIATGKIDKYMLKNNNDNAETNSVDAHNNSNSVDDEKSTNKQKKVSNNARKKKVNKNSPRVSETFLDGWVTKMPAPPDKSDCDKNNCDEISNPDL